MNSDKNSKIICVGKIISAHGVKGLVKIESYTDNPFDLNSYGPLYDANKNIEFKITIKSKLGEQLLAAISNIDDRDKAKSLTGTKLYVERNKLPKTQEEEFYINDLLGMDVVNSKDVVIGKVLYVHNFGSIDILEIKIEGAKDTQSIAFTKKNFPKIDLKKNIIQLNLF